MVRNAFLDLIQPDIEVPETFWATVDSTTPLRVKRDEEPVIPATPKTLERVSKGDRVLCLQENRQVIVLGKMGGLSAPTLAYPEANRIRIGSSTYIMSGSAACPSFTWDRQDGQVYSTTVQVPIPYMPPFPWTFNWSIQETGGFSHASNGVRFPAGGIQSVRLLQLHNASTTAIKRLQWQLVNA